MKQVVRAIQSAASSDATLFGLVDNNFYYDEVPQNVSTPYIVYYLITRGQTLTFRQASSWEDVVVQFSIYHSSRTPETILDVFNNLDTVFNQTTLTYTSGTAIGIKRENTIGPFRLDGEAGTWLLTADYRVRYLRT